MTRRQHLPQRIRGHKWQEAFEKNKYSLKANFSRPCLMTRWPSSCPGHLLCRKNKEVAITEECTSGVHSSLDPRDDFNDTYHSPAMVSLLLSDFLSGGGPWLSASKRYDWPGAPSTLSGLWFLHQPTSRVYTGFTDLQGIQRLVNTHQALSLPRCACSDPCVGFQAQSRL